jgi:hypothetical protein
MGGAARFAWAGHYALLREIHTQTLTRRWTRKEKGHKTASRRMRVVLPLC